MPVRPRLTDTLTGLVLVLLGSLVLSAVAFITYGDAPALEKALFDLGIAWIAALSALGQGSVLVGAWLLWRGGRR